MKNESIDKLVWVAIYAGLIVGGFGLSLRDSSPAVGWPLFAIALLLVVAGGVLIYIRSRRKSE